MAPETHAPARLWNDPITSIEHDAMTTPSVIAVTAWRRFTAFVTKPWQMAMSAGLMSVMISSGAFLSMWRVTYCGNVK